VKTNLLTGNCCAREIQKGKISDKSLYQVDSTWTTDAGKQMTLSSLAGRPQVVTMFFTSCEYACPILANDMKKLEAALPDAIRTNVGFVLVTFDSERDTPNALAKYRKARSIPEHWTLLTAGPDDILELAALLGVKFKKDTRGQFAHSNLITVLNSEGEIATQQVGLNRDPLETAKLLKELLRNGRL
jgi:protein SCO1/2